MSKFLGISFSLLFVLLSFFASGQSIQDTIPADSIVFHENTIKNSSTLEPTVENSIRNVIDEKSLKDESNLLMSIPRGILGMGTLILIAYLFSTNRKAISWRVVGIGLGTQLVLAFGILNLAWVRAIFEFFGKIFIKVLDFTRDGSEFLFGSLLNIDSFGFIFALQILPTIIFFSALTSVLFYLGIIQKVVYGLAWLLTKAMHISGAESLSVAGNIFLGQTEAPLLIKAYLEKMNKSEMLLVNFS